MQIQHKRFTLGRTVRRARTRLMVALSAGALMVSSGGMSLAVLGTAHADAGNTVVVHKSDLAGSISDVAANPNAWFMYNDSNDTIDNSLGNFVMGPDTPVHGHGGVQFTLGAAPMDRKNIATYQFSNVPLSDITDLSYTAYSHAGSGGAGANASPYLNFNVDFSGTDTWQKRLVYVPAANMASVPQDTWNTFDTVNSGNGMWTWSGFDGNGNKWPDGNTNRYRSWNDIKAAWPSAKTRTTDSWLGVRVGEPGPNGYTGDVDALTFGTSASKTTYDFEPVVADGQITAPTANAYVKGTTNLTATYADNETPNADGVQWAVRTGMCSATTDTVLGNVDSHADAYTWDGASFAASFDTTTAADGKYCFVFNPIDDPGQPNVRETQDFTVDNTRPDVSFVAPTDFSSPFATGPEVTVAASDETSGLDVLVIHAYNSDTNAPAKFCTATAGELAAGTMHCDLSDLPVGNYYIKAGANDKAGNNQTINSGTFAVQGPQSDTTKPTVAVEHPENGATMYTGSFTVDGTAADSESGVDHVAYTVTKITKLGGSYMSTVANGTADGTANWSFDTHNLKNGYYRLKVQAFDAAGNWKYDYHDVRVMTAPTDKKQCKDNGWRNFTEQHFRNQGDCMKYVERHSHGNHHGHHWWKFWGGWNMGWWSYRF